MLSTLTAHHMAHVAGGTRVRGGVAALGHVSMWSTVVPSCSTYAFGDIAQNETTKRPTRRLRKRPT